MGPGVLRSLLAVFALSLAVPAEAQLPSNASLQGTYHVRYLGVIGSPCGCPISFAGTAIFDGRGTFQITGQGTFNNGSDHAINGPGAGRYTVLASGALRMDNPFANGAPLLLGGVGTGVAVASSSDSGYLDILVAIPAASSASNATLQGTYQVAALEFGAGSTGATRNAFFPLTADGAGGLGNVTVNGTSQALNHAATSQVSGGATYSVRADGTGTLNLPAPAGVTAANQILAGSKTLYSSPDGNVFLAGAGTGYDLVIGVRQGAPATLSGQYFTAALENLADGSAAAGIYASQGSTNEVGNAAGDEVVHQRVSPDGLPSYDQTFADRFPIGGGTAITFAQSQYAAGAGGSVVIGSGNGTHYQVFVAVKLQTLAQGGVFLNPAGVVNAATNAPFTARISPGEVVTLYGSNLSGQTLQAPGAPFPPTLGGVQVTINNTAAPIYYVSSGLVSAVVPYAIPTDGTLVTVKVTNNGTDSNTVQMATAKTSPGVFTVPAGGIGSGAILHADYSLVSANNPARAGETVQIFLTGLGAVQPAVAAGAPGPVNPLSTTVNGVAVYIDGQAAAIAYQGLAPTLGGLYQVNAVVPNGVRAGNADLEITTIDADTLQSTIAIR